jgi:hypothetical protein
MRYPGPRQKDLKADDKRRRGIAKPIRRYCLGSIKTPKCDSTSGEVLVVVATRLAKPDPG